MDYRFHPATEAELNDAIDYYESLESGLGLELAEEVHKAIMRATEFPQAWSFLRKPGHRSLVKRFPFGILYTEQLNGIFVLAVMNLHREPNYWVSRQ